MDKFEKAARAMNETGQGEHLGVAQAGAVQRPVDGELSDEQVAARLMQLDDHRLIAVYRVGWGDADRWRAHQNSIAETPQRS